MKKRLFLFMFLVLSSLGLFAQVSIGHIDTNGPKGECLFPEDENGFAEFKEIIPYEISKSAISSYILAWMNGLKRTIILRDEIIRDDFISFHGGVDIDDDLPFFKTMTADSTKYYSKADSELSFDCSIEIREGRFKYRFYNIESERSTIKGKNILSVGPINDVVWNRVNGLKQLKASASKSHIAEYDQKINLELLLYKVEYQVIIDMVNSLQNNVKASLEEETW